MADKPHDRITLATDRHPWERQPGEPDMWWQRFCKYRLLTNLRGGRSILAIYRAEREEAGLSVPKRHPGAWDAAAAKWLWRERAEALDVHEQEAITAAVEEERRAARIEERRNRARRAIDAGKLVANHLQRVLGDGEGTHDDPKELAAAINAVANQHSDSRKEFGDDVQRHEVTGNAALLAAVQQAVTLGQQLEADEAEREAAELAELERRKQRALEEGD